MQAQREATSALPARSGLRLAPRPLDTWRVCGRPVDTDAPGSNCTCGEPQHVQQKIRAADELAVGDAA